MPANMTFEVILHQNKNLDDQELRYESAITKQCIPSAMKNTQTFNPDRTSSYASALRSMQFNVKPFMDRVSDGMGK